MSPSTTPPCSTAYTGKGGIRGRRELPRPALTAIVRSLADVGKDLASMHPGESLWQASAGPNGVSSATFYNRFRGYLAKAGLPLSGVHLLRHTAAKLRRDSRRVGRVRKPVPRPQLARRHHHLPSQTRG